MNPLQQAIWRASVARDIGASPAAGRAQSVAQPAQPPRLPQTVEDWVARQHEIHAPIKLWFAIDGEIEPRVEDIRLTVAKHFNLSKVEFESKRRTQRIVRARQITMYLARQLTRKSFPEIGRRLGGLDHSTIIYGADKIASLMKQDAELNEAVNELQAKILKDCE